jgi:hypothetical protein
MTAQVSHTPAECQSRKSIARRRLRRSWNRCYSIRDIGQDGTQVALSMQQASNRGSAGNVRARSKEVSPHGDFTTTERRPGHEGPPGGDGPRPRPVASGNDDCLTAPRRREASDAPYSRFSGSPATWTPLLPALEQHHDVLAPTLLGHCGGPGSLVGSPATPAAMVDALERDMNSAGFEQAHLVGNSLGGWLAPQLAARGRALSTTALASAGGWNHGGPEHRRL